MPPVSPTPLLVKPGKRLGEAGKTRFFGHKYLADQLSGVYFGPHKEGIGAHSPDIFTASCSFHVFREIVDFRQNFGIFSCENVPRYSCQNFIPGGPWGFPFSALEKLAPSPKIFAKFWENFLGVVHPGGPGAKI